MRIIKLQNKKIKDILEKKGEIVKQGRALSAEIEEKAKTLVDAELEINGIKVDKKRNCSGKYEQFVKFFSQDNQYAITQNIQKELKSEVEALDKLNGFVNKYNGEVSRLIDKEKIELGEYESLSRVDLNKGGIEIEVLDNVEEYKKRYKEIKAKK
jgi:hypothetical protein